MESVSEKASVNWEFLQGKMKHGLFFEKQGMTRIIQNEMFIPVTVLKLIKSRVLKISNGKALLFVEGRNRLKKPQLEMLKKHGISEIKNGFLKEVILSQSIDEKSEISVSMVNKGEFVDAVGTSISHGFSGGMYRWNFSGMPASHGASLSHRSSGSTGCRQDPGRTFKGKKMPGHYGNVRVTVQNLKVVDVLQDKQLVLVNGSVPGRVGCVILLKSAVKKMFIRRNV